MTTDTVGTDKDRIALLERLRAVAAGSDRPYAASVATDAIAFIEAAERDNAQLREGLEPFAAAAELIEAEEDKHAYRGFCADEDAVQHLGPSGEYSALVTYADFRRARALLKGPKP